MWLFLDFYGFFFFGQCLEVEGEREEKEERERERERNSKKNI